MSPHLLRAAALEIWATSRERAIGELSAQALSLERSGAISKAAQLRFAAEHLRFQMSKEGAEAQALRAATSEQPFARISFQ